jgi:hypothetical protein
VPALQRHDRVEPRGDDASFRIPPAVTNIEERLPVFEIAGAVLEDIGQPRDDESDEEHPPHDAPDVGLAKVLAYDVRSQHISGGGNLPSIRRDDD